MCAVDVQVNGEKSAEDMGLVSYQVSGILEHVPFQAKECDIRNSPRLGDEVEFDLAQVKRTKDHIAQNIRIVQRASHTAGHGYVLHPSRTHLVPISIHFRVISFIQCMLCIRIWIIVMKGLY